MTQGGNLVDHHSCDFFPERCVHAVCSAYEGRGASYKIK